MAKVAGLDVHSKWCVAVIQDEASGKVIAEEKFETTEAELGAFVRRHELAGCHVGLESGAISFFVAKHLAASGAKPLIIDAAEVRKKARSKRQKSDSRDAFEICDGLRRGYFVSIVVIPDALCLELREVICARRHFVRVKTQEVNAIKGLLRKIGLAKIYRAIKKPEALEALKARKEIDAGTKERIEQHAKVWLVAFEQVTKLDKQLEALEKKCEEKSSRLRQIPGVGPLVSLCTIAYVGEPSRFASAKHVGSYAGLVAETDNSADRERYGHITKRGPRELRSMLVQAAHQARNESHPFHAEYVRLAKKRGRKVAIVAIAHRLIRVMWAMLRDGTEFKPPTRASEKWDQLTADTQKAA